ncbi:cya1 [Symbiodinium pilosum]|uniref:Cya1 protein n=1 Tax=Symbiodinium pilosum TaxID=2952 RepID=A0A812VLR6_SYMPI|nr:cya1 [Symbiodinium pilosum]
MLNSKTSKDKIKTAEELENLNMAFRAMRSAIRSWSLFVPPSVVERFYVAGLEAKVGVARCEVTVLFCDIDGFEETCREMHPDAVLSKLTGVLGTIADEIQLQNGTFLEFISDEVMAVFNAPNKLPNHASAGLLCALAIQKAVVQHKVLVANQEKHIVKWRALMLALACRGWNIGSHQRIKYGLLGDGVNLAARMKGFVASCPFVKDQDHALGRPVDLVAVKGKSEPTKVCEVIGFMHEHPSLAEAVKRHQLAFDLYLARKFREAMEKFEEVSSLLAVADRPDDETSNMMICRCEEYMKNPPPPEWDGVEHLKSKSFGVPQRPKNQTKDSIIGDAQQQNDAKLAQEMANGILPAESVESHVLQVEDGEGKDADEGNGYEPARLQIWWAFDSSNGGIQPVASNRQKPVVGRTFPDFGRIVSRSPGSTARLQENEAGRSELFGPALVLNVGGTLFRTTPSTLRKAPFFDSMLRHTVEGGFGATVDSEGHWLFAWSSSYGHRLLGHYFVDRSGFIDAIRAEASFYGLEGDQQLPVPRITEYVSVWQHKDDTSIYVDCLEQTIREEGSPSVPHAGCDSVNGDNGPREDVKGAKVVRTSLATAAVHATSRHRFGQARPRKVPGAGGLAHIGERPQQLLKLKSAIAKVSDSNTFAQSGPPRLLRRSDTPSPDTGVSGTGEASAQHTPAKTVWLSCLFYSGPRGCLLRTLSVEADCLMQRRASRSRTHGGARPIPDTPTLLQKPALILAVIGLPVGFRLGQSSPPLLAHPAACAWVGQGLAWSPPTLCSGLEGLAAASVVQHDFSSHTEGSCKACAGLCWPVFVEGTNESCEQWAVVPFRVASPTQAARLVGAGSGDWGVGEHRQSRSGPGTQFMLSRKPQKSYVLAGPFHSNLLIHGLANAPASISGLACAVLQEIGGFNKEELEAVQHHLDQVPLKLLGELCEDKLIELASDAELAAGHIHAELPVKQAAVQGLEASESSLQAGKMQELAGRADVANPDQRPVRPRNGWHDSSAAKPEWSERDLQEQLQLQKELEEKQLQLQRQQQQLQQRFDRTSSLRDEGERRNDPSLQRGLLPASSSWNLPEDVPQVPALRTLQHSPSAPEIVNGGQDKHAGAGTASARSLLPPARSVARQPRSATPDAPRNTGRPATEHQGAGTFRASSSGRNTSFREREAPVHIRLYQEKDDRRRRLEQARLRRLEQEEEDLRAAAERALGRQPSPARPRREPSPGKVPAPQSVPAGRGDGVNSPATRVKPPVPDRPGSAGRARQTGEGTKASARKTTHDRARRQESESNDVDGMLPAGLETSSIASIASDSNAVGQHSLVSVGTGVEDSVCGDAATSAGHEDEVQRLRQMVSSQQQRIDFLENMHQQALRHLRKSREELAQAQQQRLEEADKVLGLEQLISELQVHRFEGSMHHEWENWLRRARSILEGG